MTGLINSNSFNLKTPTTSVQNSFFQDFKNNKDEGNLFIQNCCDPINKKNFDNDKLIKNKFHDLTKINKTSADFKEIVSFFKRDWPKDKKLEDFGFKLLCFLFVYNWSSTKDSWNFAKKILADMLIKSLADVNDEQKKQCLKMVKSILFSSYFTPLGKTCTKSWFNGEIKYSAYSDLLYDLLKSIDDVASKFELTIFTSKIDFAKKIGSGLSNLMQYAINRPWTTFALVLSMQSSGALAGWKKPKWVEKVQETAQIIVNEVNISPIPIPGPYCGPDKFKPLAWVIADKWQFANIHVSFVDACKDHDSCWGGAHSHGDYNRCDDKFINDLKTECHEKLTGNARNVCDKIAEAYYGGVRAVTEVTHFDL